MKIMLSVLLTLCLSLLPLAVRPASGATAAPETLKRQEQIADPVQQALGEEAEKAKSLPAALQKKAEKGLSALLTVALVLIACTFVLALIKTAYGAIQGDGFIWAGALAVVVSAVCFVAVLHAKTLLYLVAQYEP